MLAYKFKANVMTRDSTHGGRNVSFNASDKWN